MKISQKRGNFVHVGCSIEPINVAYTGYCLKNGPTLKFNFVLWLTLEHALALLLSKCQFICRTMLGLQLRVTSLEKQTSFAAFASVQDVTKQK